MPTMSRVESALVTGASGGLGAAIARRLAAEGVRVAVTGRRHDPLERLARETGAAPVVCDLADRADLTDLLVRAGEVDVLVSNAALPASGTVDDFTVEQIDRANRRQPAIADPAGPRCGRRDGVARPWADRGRVVDGCQGHLTPARSLRGDQVRVASFRPGTP
jgi:NAD(P)-dependent dehydrogenase (short-subunit alcohol dehydrogenase family)